MSSLRDSAERIDQAEELFESGDHRRAIALFTEAIALCTQAISPHPRLFAVAYQGRARSLDRLGKSKESARDLETAQRFEELARHHVWIRDQREHRLTKTISLALCYPAALARLKETGECDVAVPEALFDEDSPGHYMRRLKSVSLTVAVGERSDDAVRCTLALLGGTVRTSASTTGGYPRTGAEDPRFEDGKTTHSIDAIAVWRGDDMLELDYTAGIFQPFDGQGPAGSEWRIGLDVSTGGLLLSTVEDVCLHFNYTARDGGDQLKAEAEAALGGR